MNQFNLFLVLFFPIISLTFSLVLHTNNEQVNKRVKENQEKVDSCAKNDQSLIENH